MITPSSNFTGLRTYEIKRVNFQVGDKVEFDWARYPTKGTYGTYTDEAYYTRKLVGDLIKYYRRCQKNFNHEGKLYDEYKRRIRACLKAVETATSIEVVGIVPRRGNNLNDCRFNECYLNDGQSHGGLRHEYILCFRFTNGAGDKCAYIPEATTISEKNLRRETGNES